MGTRTLALLFADIEGSTRLLVNLGDRYAALLADYHRIIRQAVAAAGGTLAGTEGDGVFAVFPTASGGAAAAVEAQRLLAAHDWPGGEAVRARMGLHIGEVEPVPTGYVGIAVHVAARVASAAHGGQVLLSSTVKGFIHGSPLPGTALRDLGEHLLKDLEGPERLFQLGIDGLPSDFPPPRGSGGKRHNIPAALSSFVGRDAELHQVGRLLESHRLVTVIGAGGAGKTRIAMQAGVTRLDAFPGGVWLADLSPLSDPEQLAAHVARAVGVAEVRTGEIADQLLSHLEGAQLLLLVDNCEHLMPEVAILVQEILRTAPGVTVLATSREPLGIRGEVQYRLPPLGLPAESSAADVSRDAPAVRLFIDRAIEARPSLTVDDDLIAAVAEVCRRLDGIPLALELAAARLRVLTPHQLLDRLDDTFKVLGTAEHSAPARHRTLAATLDWSHDLLADTEQVLLRRLGVFAGGWTLEAAEAVCAAEPLAQPEILDALDRLVASSLVSVAELGQHRYRMLRTVRSYARERLAEAGEADASQKAFAACYRAMVAGGGQDLGPREQALWLLALEADHDNLRAALRWLIDSGDSANAVGLAGDLVRFWYRRGHYAEARSWIDEVLAMPDLEMSIGLANVLRFAAATAMDRGDEERALALADRAAAVARRLDDESLLARSLNVRAGIAWRVGDLAGGRVHYNEAIALLDGRSDPFLVRLLANKTHLLIDMGLLDDAEESLGGLRRTLDGEVNVQVLHVEGTLRHARGELERAEELLAAAVGTYRELGLMLDLASSLRTHALVAWAAGRRDAAQARAEEAAATFEQAGDPLNSAATEIILAGIAVDDGMTEEARESLARNVAALHEAGWRLELHDGLAAYVAMAARDADWVRCARLVGAVAALAASFPMTGTAMVQQARARMEAQAKAALGDVRYRTECGVGGSMTLDEAVEYALSGAPSDR